MAAQSAAMSLRESFGDRKIPEISRKITACVSCRKLKIKCHMKNEKPPCTRCKARGNACTVNKSLQSLLEGDASWKEQMEERMAKLEAHIIKAATEHPNPSKHLRPQKFNNDIGQNVPRNDNDEHLPNDLIEAPQIVTLNLSCSLGAFPASSMINFTLADPRGTSKQGSDFICHQLIPINVAETLFTFYKTNMDTFAYDILTRTDSLASMRERSSLLTAAICTVAALCSGSEHFRVLFDHLKSEVSGKVFSNNHEFDDVRALCVGALWLNEVSTALNSLAVRIATELNLHRCITKMPHKKRACYDRTRLYFLVYLCDHHCSLSHGKPPLTRDFHSLKSPRDFLRTEFSFPSDLKLISQVELWSISNRVFDMFGADIDNCVATQRLGEIPALNEAYEQWYGDWLDILTFVEVADPFPRRVFDLYYHSAKLYLFSHIFRGHSRDGTGFTNDTTSDLDEFASSALKNALSIVCDITKEASLQTLPDYIGTVTAFASVCLVKASTECKMITCDADGDDAFGHLRRLVQVSRSSAIGNGSTHPLRGIAESLEGILSGGSQSHHDDGGPFNGTFGFDFAFEGFDMLSGNFDQTAASALFETE
ncbi:hypothetical protein N7532_000589 [Penicillium argentinense]|uniref:Zn(2)-C6 fungal-type domain-containing protein n=1 Tax=Penicillium argentinense TaxID=1131581 RepID=A0A9W9KMR8_9EURO|nr:uncharacterized protein N7532_000589 [Penicillium argentinense]KAJ5112544.1 hypothetical protein N7532_000589 [Penicillium argentinense]